MSKHRRADLIPIARSLAAAGHSTSRIAAALTVPLRTIQRWAKGDRDAGRPWHREQRPARHARQDNTATTPPDASTPTPAQVISRLRDRLAQLVAYAPPPGHEAGYERRILDLTRAIDALRSEYEDPAAALAAMDDFVRYLQERYVASDPATTASSREAALGAVRTYLYDLEHGYPTTPPEEAP